MREKLCPQLLTFNSRQRQVEGAMGDDTEGDHSVADVPRLP